MPDEIQEWRQVRDEAIELADHADKKVAEGEAEQAALEGGVTDAEAKRRRRGMGAVVWPVAAVLASWAETIRTNQEAVMQFAFGGTAAASVAVAMVLPPPLYQPPQASDGTPRPVMVRPYVPPAPPSTARAKPRPAAPAEIKPTPEPAEPAPEPPPAETTPTETAPPADVTAVDPPAAAPKVKVKPKVPKLVDDECLTDVAVSGNVDCLNG